MDLCGSKNEIMTTFSWHFLIKRARNGNAEAQFEVGKMLVEQGKLKRAVCFLEHASLRGNLEAEKYLHCLAKKICNRFHEKTV